MECKHDYTANSFFPISLNGKDFKYIQFSGSRKSTGKCCLIVGCFTQPHCKLLPLNLSLQKTLFFWFVLFITDVLYHILEQANSSARNAYSGWCASSSEKSSSVICGHFHSILLISQELSDHIQVQKKMRERERGRERETENIHILLKFSSVGVMLLQAGSICEGTQLMLKEDTLIYEAFPLILLQSQKMSHFIITSTGTVCPRVLKYENLVNLRSKEMLGQLLLLG